MPFGFPPFLVLGGLYHIKIPPVKFRQAGRAYGLQLRDGLDLAQDILRQLSDGAAAPGGLAGEELGIDLVEGGEIAHVRQEAGGLDHPAKVRARGLQNGGNIAAAALRLGGDALGDIAGGGIHGDLAGAENKRAYDHALGIGADGGGRVFGRDDSHDITSFLLCCKL